MNNRNSLTPWKKIDSLYQRNVAAFPTDALPTPLRAWVRAESIATQTPPDLAAMVALTVCAAAIAGRVKVEARKGWLEPTNLFTTVILDPANRKSPVFSAATRPLREIEEELVKAAKPEVAKAESKRRQVEGLLKSLEKKGERDPEAQKEALELSVELDNLPLRHSPRLLVDDSTPEKIGMMLCEQEGRIASLSPEGNVFDLMAGFYSKNSQPQFDVYLKGHSGDDLRTDRVGRASVLVREPALTCGYTVQRSVIQDLGKKPSFRGRGLLGRFLYSIPTSWIGRRQIAPPSVTDFVQAEYRQLIRRLNQLDCKVTLQLTTEASSIFQDWEREIESMLVEGGRLERIQDWGGKLAGATLRIAAILNCIKFDGPREVQGESMESAIEVARYLISHAEAVFSLLLALECPLEEDARYLLRWIKQEEKRAFTRRDAHQHGKRKFPMASDLDPALEELVERAYIRKRPPETKQRGRNPSPVFEVNPEFLNNRNSDLNRSQNSHNCVKSNSNSNSEDSEDVSQEPKELDRVKVKV